MSVLYGLVLAMRKGFPHAADGGRPGYAAEGGQLGIVFRYSRRFDRLGRTVVPIRLIMAVWNVIAVLQMQLDIWYNEEQ